MVIGSLEQNKKSERKTKYSYEELKQKYIDEKEEIHFKKKRNLAKDYNMIVTFIISIVLYIGLGVFIGYYIDELLHTKPLFILILSFIGIGAAYRNLYVTITKHDKKGSSKDDEG